MLFTKLASQRSKDARQVYLVVAAVVKRVRDGQRGRITLLKQKKEAMASF